MRRITLVFAFSAAWVIMAGQCDAQFSRHHNNGNHNNSQVNNGRNASTVGSSHEATQRRYNEAMMRQNRQRQVQQAYNSAHRAMPYGNAPYYNRPPVSPYYVVPTYANPYPQYNQGYGYYIQPWGGQMQYVPPTYYPYYRQNNYNPYYRY